MSFNTSTKRKDDVSIKFKATNLNSAKQNTLQLEIESRQMEERLQNLKSAMSREREERNQSNSAGFWKSGQTGTLGSYGKDALKPSKPKGQKTRKIKVLKEEPVVPAEPKRSSGHISQRGTGKENKVKGPRCGQCEEKGAQVTCVECGEDYCAPCFAGFHLKGNLKKHRSVPFGTAGQRAAKGIVTPRQGASQTLISSPSSTASQQMAVRSPNQPVSGKTAVTPPGPVNAGPSLLDGAYNEDDSAADFQAALRAWRNPGAVTTTPPATDSVSPAKSSVSVVESCGTSTATDGVKNNEIKFKQSLTYAERLLLKKHRRSDIQPLPSDLASQNSRSEEGLLPNDVMSSWSGPMYPQEQEETPVEVLRSLHSTCEDGIVWRDVHRAMKEDPNATDEWRSESRVSIIELENEEPSVKSSRRHRGKVEVTPYNVTEAGRDDDLEILTARKESASRTDITHSPAKKTTPPRKNIPTPPGSAARGARKLSTPSSKLTPSHKQLPTSKPDSKTSDLSIDLSETNLQNQVPATKPSSRSKSARQKSARGGPSRPQSRAKSRAETRLTLFGEGDLTKTPSEALRQVAQMTPRLEPTLFLPTMTDFFTGGIILPEDVKDKVISPTKSKPKESRSDTEIPKWKVSYNLYNMGPRSWKPPTSLQDTVSEQEAIETIDVAAPQLRTFSNTDIVDDEQKIETVSFSIAEGVSRTESTLGTADRLPSTSDLAKMKVTSSKSKQSPRTPRNITDTSLSSERSLSAASSKTLTPEPRPESRAIVVDGDDLSFYDNEQGEQHEDDEESLHQLEWELASHEGRVTSDGKMSRLSVMTPEADNIDEDTEDVLDVNIRQLRLLQDDGPPSPGASYNARVDVLMDDFEDMEKQIMEEDEVKALQ